MTIFYVDSEQSWDDAIAAANDGDTIRIIDSWTASKEYEITNRLTIEGVNNPTITQGASYNYGIEFKAGSAGSVIRNFSMIGVRSTYSNGRGIGVRTDNITVSGMTVSSWYVDGIICNTLQPNGTGSVIRNNTVLDNYRSGISLFSYHDTIVDNNYVVGVGAGGYDASSHCINIVYADRNTITNNTLLESPNVGIQMLSDYDNVDSTVTTTPSGGDNYLYDTAGGWVDDEWNGRMLTMIDGTAAGNTYYIEDTDDGNDRLTLSSWPDRDAVDLASDGILLGDNYTIARSSTGNVIENNTVQNYAYKTQSNGISIRGRDTICRRNVVISNIKTGTYDTWGIGIEGGLPADGIGEAEGTLCEHNVLGGDMLVKGMSVNQHHVIIRYNQITINTLKSGTASIGIKLAGNRTCDVYYNIIRVDTEGQPGQTSLENRTIGIFMRSAAGGENNPNIYNNVIYSPNTQTDTPDFGIFLSDTAGGDLGDAQINNNIIMGFDRGLVLNDYGNDGLPGGLDYSYNCFYDCDTSNAVEYDGNSVADTGSYSLELTVTGGITSNPKFANVSGDNFKLLSTSPCLGAGIDVGLVRDHINNTVPRLAAPSMGAFEYPVFFSFEMADYLDYVTPDYNATLDMRPLQQGQVVGMYMDLEESNIDNLVTHLGDDGSEQRVSLSASFVFYATMSWASLEAEDAGTIFDWYFDANKANCRERSFKWRHPEDGHTYVVRFGMDMKRSIRTINDTHGFSDIRLKVLGKGA